MRVCPRKCRFNKKTEIGWNFKTVTVSLIVSQYAYENEIVCQNDDYDSDDFDVTVYRVLWFHLYLSLLYLKDSINERLLH